jgi:hypothetical protein
MVQEDAKMFTCNLLETIRHTLEQQSEKKAMTFLMP